MSCIFILFVFYQFIGKDKENYSMTFTVSVIYITFADD